MYFRIFFQRIMEAGKDPKSKNPDCACEFGDSCMISTGYNAPTHATFSLAVVPVLAHLDAFP